jgi:hypothetical protein
MKSPRPSTNSSSSPSFALISVLALVSLAALTATAFLASARLERQATMPLTQATMLDMALDSGAVAALRLLEYGGGEQFNHVVTYWRGTNANDWTNELGYLLIGSVQSNDISSNPLKVKYYFCFSSAALTNLGTNLIEYTNHESAGDQARFNRQINNGLKTAQRGTNFAAGQSTNIPLLGDIPIPTNGPNRFTSPPVGWVYINQDVRVKPGQTNTTNVPVTRFAFYVQDLSSMVDADRMGGFTNGTPYRASTALPTNYTQGTNPAEISLTNLTGTVLTNSTNAANFTSTNNRVKYLSPGMLVLSNAGKLNTNDLRYVTTGLHHWTNAYERIPFGLGYSNCGTTDKGTNKYSLATGGNVANIAATITTNLPNFSARSGAMNSNAYISNIAANIVDYVDTDTDPTIDSSAGIPNWRGVEAIAWPNEVFTRIHLSNRVTAPPNYEFEVIVKNSLEVWNLSSTSIVVNGADYSISNNLNIPIRCQNWYGNMSSNTTGKTAINEVCTNASFTLPPNSYGVLSAPSRNLKFNVPLALATNPSAGLTIHNTANTSNSYTIYYKSKIIDATPAGRVSPKSTNLLPPQSCLFANSVNFGTSDDLGSTFNLAAGDPRGGLFVQKPAMDFELEETTPGGRNSHIPTSSGGARIVDPKVNWPDRGHSSSVDTVSAPTNTTVPQGLQKQGNTNHWVQKINNSGSMTNIMELGNIFDPIQWGDPNNPFHPRDTSAWMELNATATNFNGACGRNSLRIGRAEHQRFAWTKPSGANASDPSIPNMQMSAAALLDLFCISNQFDEGGKINLNTAPAPVLRALAGGIYLRSDPALLPGGTNFSIPPAMVEAFAQGVMRFRAKYPFYSPSQLSFIGTATNWPNTNTWPTNAVFGSTNTISLVTNSFNTLTNTSLGITEWNDQAAEEWFAKIFTLSTVYSRNFRVYVIAQKATNQAGNLIGVGPVVRKYYNVLIRQNGSDAGDEPGASPVITFQSYY